VLLAPDGAEVSSLRVVETVGADELAGRMRAAERAQARD